MKAVFHIELLCRRLQGLRDVYVPADRRLLPQIRGPTRAWFVKAATGLHRGEALFVKHNFQGQLFATLPADTLPCLSRSFPASRSLTSKTPAL